METALGHYQSFETFFEAMDADLHLSEKFKDNPEMAQRLKASIERLYVRSRDDAEFQRRLSDSPKETALSFLQSEVSEYELSDDLLESVAGGAITTESTLPYDIGWTIGAAVGWVAGLFE